MEEKDKVVDKLKEVAAEGKISCTQAREVAKDLEIELAEIGKLCDDNDIKIYGCELGCF